MRKGFRILLALVCLLVALGWVKAAAASPLIEILRVEGTINPVVASYISRGVDHAEERGATAVVIMLDTPGGLYSSTEDIVDSILNAQVPVVVYVSSMEGALGGWAGSAGVFITLAAHVAAMSDGSRIGAATPVSMGTSGEEIPEAMQKKITEDAAAWVRSLANLRGRNPELAERAVREAASFTEVEARENNLIDLIASNLDSVITQLEGREVTLFGERTVTLHTEGYTKVYVDMTLMEKFLFTIANPNIAYILLSVGMLGIFFELANPGSIFPGVVGGVSLLLALFALGILSAYYIGIVFIVLAFVLFLAEIWIASHGLLTIGGVSALTAGSLLLFTDPVFSIDWRVIAGVVALVTLFFVFVVSMVVRTHRRRQPTGRESLVGERAVVRRTLEPIGFVFIHGERWEATLDEGRAEPGEEVIITGVDGLKLKVTKKTK